MVIIARLGCDPTLYWQCAAYVELTALTSSLSSFSLIESNFFNVARTELTYFTSQDVQTIDSGCHARSL
jgi:hypothetical protein